MILDSFGRDLRLIPGQSKIRAELDWLQAECTRQLSKAVFMPFGPPLYDQFGCRVYSTRPIRVGQSMAIRIPVKFEGKTA